VAPGNFTAPLPYPAQTISAGQALTQNFPGRAILTLVQR
jgi:hypothetical protein